MKGRLYYFIKSLEDGRIIIYLSSKDYFKENKTIGFYEKDEEKIF